MPCPPPGGHLNPGITPESLLSLALAGEFFTTSAAWEAPSMAGLDSIPFLILAWAFYICVQEFISKTEVVES